MLQDEIYHLRDLIKQQEGATKRVQDSLDRLEGKLGAADTAYSVLVHYQLRRLWQAGRELITQFVADLVRQQDELERRAHLSEHNRRMNAKKEAALHDLQAAQLQHEQVAQELAALQAQRAKLTRFWHYFKRRSVERRIGQTQEALAGTASALAQTQGTLEQITREATPEFAGLSLAARRAINLAAIAYGEVLCLRLSQLKTPLVQLAREAAGRSEAGEGYGSPQDCVLLMGLIARAQRVIGDNQGLAEELKVRTGRLKKVAQYRNANDSTPVAESLNSTDGEVLPAAARPPNVLAEDTWDIFRIVQR